MADSARSILNIHRKNTSNINKKTEREHVTFYIYSNPKIFKIVQPEYPFDYSNYRLTLDEESDYKLLEKVFSFLQKNNSFGYLDDLITLLSESPELVKLNQDIKRNEGLEKSISD